MDTLVSDFEMNAHVYWSADNKLIYFRHIDRGDTNIWAVPADGNGYATQVTNFEGAMQSLDIAGNTMAFTRANSVTPGDVWTMSLTGGEGVQLPHWATQFKGVQPPLR